MEPTLTAILSALVAGATAKAKDVASDAVLTAYTTLKALLVASSVRVAQSKVSKTSPIPSQPALLWRKR
jgi:hypothetical protein